MKSLEEINLMKKKLEAKKAESLKEIQEAVTGYAEKGAFESYQQASNDLRHYQFLSNCHVNLGNLQIRREKVLALSREVSSEINDGMDRRSISQDNIYVKFSDLLDEFDKLIARIEEELSI